MVGLADVSLGDGVGEGKDVSIARCLVSIDDTPAAASMVATEPIDADPDATSGDDFNSYYSHSKGEVSAKEQHDIKSTLASSSGDFIVPGFAAKDKVVVGNTRVVELSGEDILKQYYQYQQEQGDPYTSSITEFDGLARDESHTPDVLGDEKHISSRALLRKLNYYHHMKLQRSMLAKPKVTSSGISITPKV